MADWNVPINTSLYTDVLSLLKSRDVDAGTMGLATPTNTPTGFIRYNRSTNIFEEWDAAWNAKTLAVAGGGTGSTTAAGARTNLGLGTIATQAANNVNISGGTIAGTTISNTNNINAAALTSGAVPAARMSTFLATANNWSAAQTLTGGVNIAFTGTGSQVRFEANGSIAGVGSTSSALMEFANVSNNVGLTIRNTTGNGLIKVDENGVFVRNVADTQWWGISLGSLALKGTSTGTATGGGAGVTAAQEFITVVANGATRKIALYLP